VGFEKIIWHRGDFGKCFWFFRLQIEANPQVAHIRACTESPACSRHCTADHFCPLLFILVTAVALVLLLCGLGLLSPHAARSPASERRGERKVDVLLRVETDNERGNIDDLLSDAAAELLAKGPLLSCCTD
jgi:hypothetical protein